MGCSLLSSGSVVLQRYPPDEAYVALFPSGGEGDTLLSLGAPGLAWIWTLVASVWGEAHGQARSCGEQADFHSTRYRTLNGDNEASG